MLVVARGPGSAGRVPCRRRARRGSRDVEVAADRSGPGERAVHHVGHHGRVADPSGRQTELAYGSHRAFVVEVGAALREYTVGRRRGARRLPGHRDGRWRAGPDLIPWPNRLAGGSYDFGGRRTSSPCRSRPGNAIHGLTRWANWTVASASSPAAVLEYPVAPAARLPVQPGLPAGVRVVRRRPDCHGPSATNAGDRPCPYGTGAHPYLTAGTARGRGHAAGAGPPLLPVDGRGSRPGRGRRRRPVRLPHAAVLDGAVVDHCFTDLERDADGTSPR